MIMPFLKDFEEKKFYFVVSNSKLNKILIIWVYTLQAGLYCLQNH